MSSIPSAKGIDSTLGRGFADPSHTYCLDS